MAVCDVTSDAVKDAVDTILEGNFAQYNLATELKLLKFSTINNGAIRVVNAAEPNRISAAWFREKVRLSDGFAATFNVDLASGNSDGFGFVIQNDSIVNAVSNGGESLGFSEAINNYLAIGFDACQDRLSNTCNNRRVRVETRTGSANPVVAATSNIAKGAAGDFVGSSVAITVQFLGTTLSVSVGGTAVLTANNINLETILGGKFAFIGFTSSNTEFGNLSPVTTNIKDLKVVQMISGSRLDSSTNTQLVDFGKVVAFNYVLVDTCNEKLTVGVPPAADTIAALQATLTSEDGTRVLEPEINAQGDDASFKISFTTPIGVETTWNLDILLGGVRAQKMPVNGIVDTRPPEPGGLKPLGIGLLAALIAVLLLGVMFIVRGLKKYRDKLKEHKEDIDYGKTKQQIDIIDREIDYQMNPLVAPLEELKKRLEANEKTIADLKAGQKDAVDSAYTVQQLQDENEKLREEMNELKKKQEIEAAGNRMSTSYAGAKGFGQKKDRKDFDQERA